VVTDLWGGDFCFPSPHILASNGKIHRQMMEVLKKAVSWG